MSKRPSKTDRVINEMITRHKSSQQKRQLRNIDRSMKKITELLRSPTKQRDDTKKPKSPPKKHHKPIKLLAKSTDNLTHSHNNIKSPGKKIRKKSINKSAVKEELLVENENEFYPKKAKRTLDVKKVILKPNHKLQLIGETNKRKRRIPNKSYNIQHESDQNQVIFSELSIVELIRYKEECDDLDDDDLMEILTCPSPVWWEEKSDEEYCEDAIWSRTPEPLPDSKTSETTKYLSISEIELNNKDEKFIKKRSKLEHLLGNMRSKVLGVNDNSECDVDNTASPDDKLDHNDRTNKKLDDQISNVKISKEHSKVIKNSDAVFKNELNSGFTKDMIKTVNNVKEINTESHKTDIKKKRDTFSKLAQAYKDLLKAKMKEHDIAPREKRNSESDLSDSMVPDEDTLINLENMDIPISTEDSEETNNHEIKSQKKENSVKTQIEITSNEPTNTRNEIVIFYKKCKSNRKPKDKAQNSVEDIFNVLKNMKYVRDSEVVSKGPPHMTTVCDLCPKKYKKVYLRDNSTVNYCMTCSSIFNTDDCTYCDVIREKSDHDCSACSLCTHHGHFMFVRYNGGIATENRDLIVKKKMDGK